MSRLIQISPVNTSHSELNAWRQCRLQWWYKYVASIVPKQMKPAISVGGIAHAVLQHYYFAPAPRTLKSMMDAIDAVASERTNEDDLRDLVAVREILKRYWTFWNTGEKKDISPIGTEVRFSEEIFWTTPEGQPLFAGKIHGVFDQIFRHTDNKIWIGEHKVRGQITVKNLEFDEQISIYSLIGTKLYGDEFGGVMLNLLRRKPSKTRSDFMRFFIKRTKAQLAITERNLALSLGAMARTSPMDVSASYSVRGCAMCFYIDLCKLHRSARELGPTIEMFYEKKTHSDPTEDVEGEEEELDL